MTNVLQGITKNKFKLSKKTILMGLLMVVVMFGLFHAAKIMDLSGTLLDGVAGIKDIVDKLLKTIIWVVVIVIIFYFGHGMVEKVKQGRGEALVEIMILLLQIVITIVLALNAQTILINTVGAMIIP